MPDDEEMERFGTLSAWSKELGIGRTTLRRHLKGALRMKARSQRGNILDAYSETAVREACADLLKNDPGD